MARRNSGPKHVKDAIQVEPEFDSEQPNHNQELHNLSKAADFERSFVIVPFSFIDHSNCVLIMLVFSRP